MSEDTLRAIEVLREELTGLVTRVDAIEARTEVVEARSTGLDQRLSVLESRSAELEEGLEHASRAEAALGARIQGEVVRGDALTREVEHLARHAQAADRVEAGLTGMGQDAVEELETAEKRLQVLEDALRSAELRLTLLEERDEAEAEQADA